MLRVGWRGGRERKREIDDGKVWFVVGVRLGRRKRKGRERRGYLTIVDARVSRLSTLRGRWHRFDEFRVNDGREGKEELEE